MKLGTQTGSLTNHVLSRAVNGQPEPTVGMGATILSWTDRHAATITAVLKQGGKLYIVVQEDTATVVSGSGHDGSATYEYAPSAKGAQSTFRQAANGMWQQVTFNTETKRYRKVEGYGLRIGEREEYRDPTF